MSRQESCAENFPSFATRFRPGNDGISAEIDLNAGDPNLEPAIISNRLNELNGMREVGKRNEDRGRAIIEGRFNFRTGRIITASGEDIQDEPQAKSLTEKPFRNKTHAKISIGGRVTEEPGRQSYRHGSITVHIPEVHSPVIRRPNEKYHRWEVDSRPDPRTNHTHSKLRPIIPSRILKAPPITGGDDANEGKLARKTRSDLSGLKNPGTNGAHPGNNFPIRDLAKFKILK